MTTRWTRAIPILPALDLAATLRFYETHLGCRIVVDPAIPKVSGFRMEVADIEALYERCQAAGIVHPNAHLEDKPWGFRQFGINDPDENLLMFAQKL